MEYELPPLPKPYSSGMAGLAIGANCTLPTIEFTADQMRAYALEAVRAERERCARICERKVKREAGHGGSWEGYGSFLGEKTGSECAAAIRAGEMKE